MKFSGNSGNSYKLYTGPCPLQPIEFKYSNLNDATFINITFSNAPLGIRTYGSFAISNDVAISASGKTQYIAIKGTRFSTVYAETSDDPIFKGESDNYKACRKGEANWYQFLHTLLRYKDTNEQFFTDMKNNALTFDNLLEQTANFEELVPFVKENNNGITTVLSVKEKDGDWKQSNLFPYQLYRFYGKSWNPENNNYIAKKVGDYLQGGQAKQFTTPMFKEFIAPKEDDNASEGKEDMPF